ncbi:MAG: helix-turn-helix domain-containing protein [Treponema sp.]|jgi:transcriptional regulator with XRE-family HTH domain|nr:helix-turn-helix domain-containing protein [Treponema sp.]
MAGARKTTGGMEIRRTLARNLKRLRDLQNVSQLDLSGLTGLTHNFINDIENCKKWISPETLAKLAAALRVQPFQFFLSEILGKDYEEDRLNIYREDFVDMFQKVASDWMNTYLPKTGKRGKKP